MKKAHLFLCFFLFFKVCNAQNSTEINRIDSLVTKTTNEARNQVLSKYETDTTINDKFLKLRFFYRDSTVKMIVVEDGTRENVSVMILMNGNVVHNTFFADGNMNEPYSTHYFINDEAYLRDKSEIKLDKDGKFTYQFVSLYMGFYLRKFYLR